MLKDVERAPRRARSATIAATWCALSWRALRFARVSRSSVQRERRPARPVGAPVPWWWGLGDGCVVRDMNELRGGELGGFGAAVIPRGGDGRSVAGECLDHREVRPGFQRTRHDGPDRTCCASTRACTCPDYGHLTIAQIESGEPQGHRFARREGLAMSARDDG